MSAPIGLATHRWRNNSRSLMLLGAYPFIMFGIAWLLIFVFVHFYAGAFSQSYGADTAVYSSEKTNDLFMQYLPWLCGFLVAWFGIAWFYHNHMIRKMSGAHSVTRREEPELYNLLENLCIAQGVPMPKLQIIETHARNAFASGLHQASYTVTVTRGLMRSLKKDELEAVLAHELAHIQNRDVRLLVVSIIVCGLFGFLTQMCWSALRRGLLFSTGRRRKADPRLYLVIFVAGIILGLGYLLTLWTRFALSRVREYDADAMAVEMTKNPDAMMRALIRISGKADIPSAPADIGIMCIENKKPFLGLFRTHPPIAQRVKMISHVTNTIIPDLELYAAPATKDERFDTSDPAQPDHRGLMQQRHFRKKSNPFIKG